MDIAESLRKARESQVPAGGFVFTIRRPTALEMGEMAEKSKGRAALPYVIGWDQSVTSLAMGLPGGDAHPVAFDPALRDEWLADRLDLMHVLVKAIFEAYRRHAERQEDAEKN